MIIEYSKNFNLYITSYNNMAIGIGKTRIESLIYGLEFIKRFNLK